MCLTEWAENGNNIVQEYTIKEASFAKWALAVSFKAGHVGCRRKASTVTPWVFGDLQY